MKPQLLRNLNYSLQQLLRHFKRTTGANPNTRHFACTGSDNKNLTGSQLADCGQFTNHSSGCSC
ncbi:hypothetical protein D3C81_2187850 [compost metagenome]